MLCMWMNQPTHVSIFRVIETKLRMCTVIMVGKLRDKERLWNPIYRSWINITETGLRETRP